MKSIIALVPVKEKDIDLILDWESKEQNIIPWNRKRHKLVAGNSKFLYYLIVKNTATDPVPLGYSILKHNSPDNKSLEFIRLLITKKHRGLGYGSFVFKKIWDIAFNEFNYQRIWHDVFVENKLAIKLYEKLGYKSFKIGIDNHSGRKLIFYEMQRNNFLINK